MNNDEITTILTAVLIVLFIVLVVLFVTFLVVRNKVKGHKESKEKEIGKTSRKKGQPENLQNTVTYNKQSIFNFMEFDKIEDNMIVKKERQKYLMVIECQGINYDLMSGLEKNSVEQGFIQFLNTLRYPIQIYVQTRTVNLESGLIKYRERINKIRDRLARKQMEYNRLVSSGYSREEIQKAELEVVRDRNLYEYGVDIINNTEKMSFNRNILRRNYFVIISYTPEEANEEKHSSEDIRNMAFSNLYTKAQTIINSLGVCSVSGKILDSEELAELLYIAYNRDDSEIYGLDKALKAEYDELYSTAPDVLDKRMKAINQKIEEDATKKANDLIYETMQESEKERQVRQREEEMDDLIDQMAELIIRENQELVGTEIAKKAREKITKKKETAKKGTTRKTKEKEGKDEKK
mgnify:FL=1